MQAAVCHAFGEPLVVEEVELDAPRRDEVLRSCAACHTCRRGQPALCETRFALDERSPLRTTGGTEIAQGLRTAAFAEHVVVHHSQAVPAPCELALDRGGSTSSSRRAPRRRRSTTRSDPPSAARRCER